MNVYEIAVQEWVNGMPQRNYVTVVAEDAHDALDHATEHSSADELYDEPIQRDLADGEDFNGRHNYDSYLNKVEFVDARQ